PRAAGAAGATDARHTACARRGADGSAAAGCAAHGRRTSGTCSRGARSSAGSRCLLGGRAVGETGDELAPARSKRECEKDRDDTFGSRRLGARVAPVAVSGYHALPTTRPARPVAICGVTRMPRSIFWAELASFGVDVKNRYIPTPTPTRPAPIAMSAIRALVLASSFSVTPSRVHELSAGQRSSLRLRFENVWTPK